MTIELDSLSLTTTHPPTGRGFESWVGYLGGAEDHWNHSTDHGGCAGTDFWQGAGREQGPANASEYFPKYSTFIFAEQHVAKIEGFFISFLLQFYYVISTFFVRKCEKF